MFTKLADTHKAAIFAVLVLCLSVGAALIIRFLELPQGFVLFSIWSFTPTVAALIMLLVVTRDGYSKEGWKSLGLHRLGLNVWWIAFGATLLITVAASAIVWATPLASFVVPEGGILNPLINFLIQVVILALTFALGEEIGMRGYLRIYTGSIWPASIAHSVHNAAWSVLGALTVTASPVLVNLYLVGDYGILILVGVVIGAIWVGYYLRSGMNRAQEAKAVPDVPPTPAATAVPR